MEAYVIALLGATGYMLSKGENHKAGQENLRPSRVDKKETPSVDHVYASKHFNKSLENVINKVDSSFQKSQSDFNSTDVNRHGGGIGMSGGVVSNNLGHMNTKTNIADRISDMTPGGSTFSQMSGVEMSNNEFRHNNMVPFFGGNVTQNTNVDKGNSQSQLLLDRFTGTGTDYNWKPKKEVENFADIKNNAQSVHGKENTLEFEQTRFEKPKYITNYLPFEQVRVGPGLDNGYTASPSGGFQQSTGRDYIQEQTRTVDDLRVKTNPKTTYDGRVVDGQKEQLSGDIGEVCKNRVDTFYQQNEDMYLKSGHSGNLKESQRPCQDLPQTNRTDTQLKTHQVNLKRAVDAITAPLQDLVRLSKKEFLVMHPRPMGNFQSTVPSKATIYDPNDVLRTTIKETTIHDDREGNMQAVATSYYDPDDVARVTVKQTTEEAERVYGNIAGSALQKGDGYDNTEYDAGETNRGLQTSDSAYAGTATSASNKPMSYSDKKNMVVNDVKEILLKGRKPTLTGVKVYNEIDNTNLTHKKIECDQHNYRQTPSFNTSGMETETPQQSQKNLTTHRNDYRELNRINPDILSPLGSNPYAKPLNVF
jgi:hypothetical protein